MSEDCGCHKLQSAEGAAQSGGGGAPSLEPPQRSNQSSGDNAMSEQKPSLIPPTSGGSTGGESGTSAPRLTPSSALSSDGAVGAWNGDKRVSALWGINQNRNSWVYITGVGWKKLANNSDTAVVALTMLAAHAKQTQTNYSYRDEADGMIHEAYVW